MTDPQILTSRCVIVGGGPAGMMAGYLFARADIETVILEKHGDFLRDFRGDTVHPSTLRIMDELGLLADFLKRPHQKISKMEGLFGARKIRLADLTRLDVAYNYVAMMPQWDFLNFIAEKGRAFPAFKVMMNAEATGLINENGRFTGVRAQTADGPLQIKADLVIGADGRHSIIREAAQLKVENIGAPIDVLWFRLSRDPASTDSIIARLQPGRMLVTLNRGDYWQCAYVIPKGGIDEVKKRGLDALRRDVAATATELSLRTEEIKSWDDVKLLTVAIDRMPRWSRPGLLCIGDAAHAMSPVGGVGINLAIQDAVAAANLLTAKLTKGPVTERDCEAVRKRRLFPAKVIQAIQVQVQNRILNPTIHTTDRPLELPLFLKLIDAVPALQGLTARVIGLGVRPEHVRSLKV